MVYLGSKARVIKYIVPIIQQTIEKNHYETFIDAMCGGCNVISEIKCKRRVAYDVNPYLIAFFNKAVYDKDFKFPEIITKEQFNAAKCAAYGGSEPKSFEDWELGLIEFFASYCAKGFKGGYGVESGNRNLYQERIRNFLKQRPRLEGVEFFVKDFFSIDTHDAVIYIDPPYKETLKYDFGCDFNYNDFYDKVKELSRNNTVLVSEEAMPERDFKCIWTKPIKRNFVNNGEHKDVREKLFVVKSQN